MRVKNKPGAQLDDQDLSIHAGKNTLTVKGGRNDDRFPMHDSVVRSSKYRLPCQL